MAKDKGTGKEKESFFQGVKSEMEKTSWPTKEKLFKYTVIVVSTVIFFMVFFWLLDVGIGNLIQLFR
ncbi:preprotein translocase subunit SecE [Staphylococcus petrasii]|uniref:preprotein translocase subunit SecE n=1 Tax=Staphylococcus petrasii TaxID=1276936 RepID=UPI000CD28A57|nr:preprotein translocase subunit SecE [Staphylococcus petrasii]PNZ82041.1 preprotein translocase subunit SecE [Staphylococcus petrasii]TGA81983.1 preprotein translocase subunit SecE [Staphylococcus petrasii]SUM60871.1 preprotein translocase subunit SecE [Staphylococcus petrasii]